MPVQSIPFVAQDQSGTGQLGNDGVCRLVKNGRYVDFGQATAIEKRRGYNAFSVTGLPANTQIDAISEHNGIKLALAGGDIYAYDPQRASWVNRGDSGNVSIVEKRHIVASAVYTPFAIDSASTNGRTLYAYGQGYLNNSYYEVRDSVTGAVVIDKVSLSTIYRIRCVATGNYLVLVYQATAGSSIIARVIDTTDDSLTGPTTIITGVAATAKTSDIFDIATASDDGEFDIAYILSADGKVYIKRFDETLTNLLTSSAHTIGAGITGIGLGYNGGTFGLLMAHAGASYPCYSVTASTLATTSVGDVSGSLSSTDDVVRVGICGTDTASQFLAVWTFRPASGTDRTISNVVDCGASPSPTIATPRACYDMTLRSKPVYDSNRNKIYCVLADTGFGTLAQRDAFIVNLRYEELMAGSTAFTPWPEARIMHGLYNDYNTYYDNQSTVTITQPETGEFEVFLDAFTTAQTEEVKGFVDLKAIRFTSNQRGRHVFVDTGALHYISGGDLKHWDGRDLSEAGFAYYPWVTAPDIVMTSGAGSFADGTYDFRVTYEHKASDGSIWRSAASPVVQVGPSGGPSNKFDLTLPSMRLTRRTNAINPITMGVYVSAVGTTGTHYRALDSNALPPINATTTAGKVAYTISSGTFSDRDILYQDGGVLFNEQPPPSDIIWTHDSSIFGIDPEDPKRVWGTKQAAYGSPPEHNSFIQIRVDSANGLTAGASSLGNMVLFDESSVYIVGGQGFTNTGGGGFQAPRKLPTSHGCISHLSVIQGGDNGDIYYLSKAGLCVLRGGSSATVISAPVQETLKAYPNVQGAALVEADSTIYWSFADDAGTDGCIVWFDYRRGKWGVDVLPSHLNAPGRLGVWDDRLAVTIKGTRNLYQYSAITDSARFQDAGYSILMEVATDELRFGGFDGMAHLRSVGLVVEQRDDGANAPTHKPQIDMDLAVNGQGGQSSTFGAGTGVTGDGGAATTYGTTFTYVVGNDRSAGEVPYLGVGRRQFSPAVSRVSSLQVWLAGNEDNMAGVALVGLELDFEPLRGTGWTSAAERD